MSPPPGFLDVLQRHAAQRPDRQAFQLVAETGAISLSYAGLADRVARLGTGLAARTVAPGDRVAICMENRPAWPVAYLATWYAGAVIVPIDPALEPHAVRRVLEHSEARTCLTSAALGAKVAAACAGMGSPPATFSVDAGGHRRWDGDPVNGGIGVPAPPEADARAWDSLADLDGPAPSWAPCGPPEGPATIMYTSGTTGSPKGVMLAERALATNIDAGLARVELTERDNVLGVLPLFHVLPLMANCLGPIWVGARVTYLSELNPDRIIAAFADHRITAFACVPLFFYRFHDRVMKGIAALPGPRRRAARALLRLNGLVRRRLGRNLGRRLFPQVHRPFGPDLRLFLTGGAKFDRAVYEDFLALGFDLVQGYGLTEATALLTAHPMRKLRADTVGTPIAGVEIRIAEPDAEGRGEILTRTPSRMLGYYRNEEATAQAFDGEWLRTGDLGRVLANGHLQVTGRAKDVIVLASGKNIYPEELEAFYRRAELVAEICILGIDDPARRGAERLHAVVVPDLEVARRRGQANVREMVKWEIDGLAIELPSPQRVTSLEIRTEPLPRTTTRKIKRFELKQEILERASRAREVEPPQPARSPEPSEEEPGWAADVRAMLARHARVESVSRADHLDLDLGLESLDRVELQAEIEEAFGIDIPAEQAGDLQTVGELLDLVERSLGAEARATAGQADRWPRVLQQSPGDIEPYLRSRPLGEALLWVLLALARIPLRILGHRVSGIENLPAEGPFILAPNHCSYVDPFLLAIALPRRVYSRIFFVGYSGYFQSRLTGALARLLRTIPIDQNRNLERAMQAAAEGLRRGMVLGIFPEGGRSPDGTVQEFRRGAGILARLLRIPVVPVGLSGTYEMWPREGRFRPHRTAVAFGTPLAPPARDDPAAEIPFVERLRAAVVALVGEAAGLPPGKN